MKTKLKNSEFKFAKKLIFKESANDQVPAETEKPKEGPRRMDQKEMMDQAWGRLKDIKNSAEMTIHSLETKIKTVENTKPTFAESPDKYSKRAFELRTIVRKIQDRIINRCDNYIQQALSRLDGTYYLKKNIKVETIKTNPAFENYPKKYDQFTAEQLAAATDWAIKSGMIADGQERMRDTTQILNEGFDKFNQTLRPLEGIANNTED